jgi:diguanylate cyclase (GGDEF)-like protein
LKLVALIGAIVAATIVSVIVAVVTSARHADALAIAQERARLTRTIAHRSDQLMHELASVAMSPRAVRAMRNGFDRDWVDRQLGMRLTGFFEHDLVFVVDASGRLLYRHFGGDTDPGQLDAIRAELAPLTDGLRGTAQVGTQVGAQGSAQVSTAAGTPKRLDRVQALIGRPALVAATLVASPDPPLASAADLAAPLVVAVKFIDDPVLDEIGGQLNVAHLHLLVDRAVADGDTSYALLDASGRTIATLAWTPQRLGREIVQSVLPFVVIAFAGFVVLATFVMRHMRRTATTIAAGEDRLRHLALHDPLSGLPNRTYFSERIESLIAQVHRDGKHAAALYLDLDQFKEVNDTLGHPAGDELLRSVAERLTRTLRSADLVARLGGDEFAVLAATATDRETAQAIAMRIINALCSPYSLNGHTIVIGVSIGIAVIDGNTRSAADVMRYADLALYRAKNEGRNRACIYDSVMDADVVERKRLEADLRTAIDDGELEVAYQPVVDASGENMIGVEALARWHHPQRGLLPPSVFIPLAENSGLITALGEHVLRRACVTSKDWPGITVAVNVSPLQFRRGNFVDTVERILNDTGCEPSCIELEVTESTFLGGVDKAEQAIARLKALGVKLALDDFGTGYSSLLYLRRFPFDRLKIDHGFVHSIETAPDAAAIVHAVVSLSRGLNMVVTAEGVETAEQQMFLRAAGVQAMQGYRFGRPMPAAEVSRRFAEERARDSAAREALAG